MMKFSANRAKDRTFVADGLRTYFEYGDLGIREATGGKFHAHVIRARDGHGPKGEWHTHTLDFQFVYILKGKVVFEYEGAGRVELGPGDCVHQPPGIRHREVWHSDDLELIELVSPAEFATQMADAPESATAAE